MKYFTYDLLTSMNDGRLSEKQVNAAEQEWISNAEEYTAIFNELSERIPNDLYKHFSKFGFHDYLLKKFNVYHESLLHTKVELILENEKECWKLSFTDITSLSFNHMNINVYGPILSPSVDSWMKEEILPVDNNILSFEILFSSGAIIKITYEDQNIAMEKLKGVPGT